MKKELDNFIIVSDIELDYFDDIVRDILLNEKRIFSFFNLEKLPKKVTIMILSYEPFKKFIVSKYGEILDYISGDSDSITNTVRILNVADQIKYTTHKNANIDRIKETVLHEIVHQCHHVYHKDCNKIIWFSEGLATNLSNQQYELMNLNQCDFNRLQDDFKHYRGSYGFSYTILYYILNNYSKEEIFMLYSNPDYLREKAKLIFEEAKIWVSKQSNIRAI